MTSEASKVRLPQPPRLRRAWGFPLAVAIPLATALFQHSAVPQLTVAPFVLLFLSVTLVAWLGGLLPGLVAVAVAAPLGNFLLMQPARQFHDSGPELLGTLLFVPTAAAIAALVGSLRSALHDTVHTEALAQRYALLSASSRDIVLLVRASDGRILEANASALSAYGYSREELLQKGVADLREATTRAEVPAQLARAAREALTFETVHRRKDGSLFPVEVTAQGGTVDGEQAIVSVVRDIRERKQAEDSLRQSEQRVRAKLESLISPRGDLGQLDLEDLVDAGALQELMSSFYALTRIPASIIDIRGKVLAGAGWQEICTRFHRVNPETCAACVESDTVLTATIGAGEFRLYRCKNNLWDGATPIFLGDRKVGNVFTGQFFFEDEVPDFALFRAQARRYGFDEERYLAALDRVPRLSREAVRRGTEFLLTLAQVLSKLGYANVLLARSLREGEVLADSLRETDRRKNEFIAMLSHELRNPLTPVRNSVYILGRTSPGSDQAQRALTVIDRQTAHLARVVDDLLDVTRVLHGKVTLQRAPVDLVALVRTVAEDHASTVAARGLQFEVEAPPEPLVVDGDATRLAQTLGNLLRNAVRFTTQGQVTLSLARDAEGWARIRVADTGTGIDATVLPRLFQPFVQADTSLERSQGGLGLGLAVSKGLVELHGGTLTAHSGGPGLGSEFLLRLPTLGTASAAAEASPPRPREKGLRVLVIEDVRDAAHSLREALELNGHTVEVAFDGRAGLDRARTLRPDAVLCDIGLPGLDGYGVARGIRTDPGLQGVLLVALTGYATPQDQEAARAAGFDVHLAKPPSLSMIEQVLARATRAA